MTKEQCTKCVYEPICDAVLRLKSSVLNRECKQSRAKVVKKKPRVAKVKPDKTYIVGIDKAVDDASPRSDN